MAESWATSLARTALAERVEICGLVDPDIDRARSLKSAFGNGNAMVSDCHTTAIETQRPDIVFDIATPDARLEIVSAALRAGCHVLTEKPMATSLDDARKIIDLAHEAGRIHAVTQNRRFNMGIRRVRASLESGVIGQVTALHADFFIGAHFGGFRDLMQHVLLLDMAIHTFDAARFLSGQEAEAVYCLETNPTGSWYAHGASATAIFECTGGVVFSYRGSWCAEGADTHWDSAWRIIGTKGTLLWDGFDDIQIRVVDGDEGFIRPLRHADVLPPQDLSLTEGHTSVIRQFVDAIDHGPTPETSGVDNIKSLAMVFGAVESSARKQRVTINSQGKS
jgi:predicted dehydrogenase